VIMFFTLFIVTPANILNFDILVLFLTKKLLIFFFFLKKKKKFKKSSTTNYLNIIL